MQARNISKKEPAISPAMQAVEQQVLELMVALTKPEMIYRLRHAGNHDLPFTSIHWLLVLPDTDQHAFAHYETLIELVRVQQESIDISVIKLSALIQAMGEGHVYYTMCCGNENLLYCNSAKTLPVVTAYDRGPYLKELTKQFDDGFAKAAWFHKEARVLFEEYDNDALCGFAVQQATELCLRIFILCVTGREQKTHSIVQLLNRCRYIAPQVAAIFPMHTAEDRNGLQILEKAYVCGRYAHDFSIEPEVLHDLMLKAGLLHKMVKKVFGEYVGAGNSER